MSQESERVITGVSGSLANLAAAPEPSGSKVFLRFAH
jgi:hypothetical protein